MTIESFLANAASVQKLYVSKDGKRWNKYPTAGFTLKTREEILNQTPVVSPVTEVTEKQEEVKPKKTKKK